MFGYNSTVICDGNNYALTVDINPSNMHDSVAFYGAFDKFLNKIGTYKTKYFAWAITTIVLICFIYYVSIFCYGSWY